MQPACAVSAPLTCSTIECSASRGRLEHLLSTWLGWWRCRCGDTRIRRLCQQRRCKQHAGWLLSTRPRHACILKRLAGPRLVKPQHLVHGGGGNDDLVKHGHRAANQAGVAALQGARCMTFIALRSCTRQSGSRRRLACGTTASRRSKQCRSSAAACSVVFGFSATREAPSYLPIQSLQEELDGCGPGSGGGGGSRSGGL